MLTIEEIASNLPLTREENLSWLKNPKQNIRPFCSCLRKAEGFNDDKNILNGFTSSGCFSPCFEQSEILKAREEIKNSKNK